MHQRSNFSKFAGDRRGSIAIYAAATLPFVIGCSALAVDMGSIYLERRTAQGIVDLAAINAAQYPDNVEGAARGTLAANGLSGYKTLAVSKGHYAPDLSAAPSLRFRPGVEPFNAVRVDLAKDARLAFGAAFMSHAPEYSVTATASIANSAMFSVGSRLAALRDGVLNDALGAMLGTKLDLSLMDYNALLSGEVQVDNFLNAVSLDLGLTGVTYDKVLDANLTFAVLAHALQASVGSDDTGAIVAALGRLGGLLRTAKGTVQLRKLLDLGNFATLDAGSSHPGLAATVNVLDMLRTAVFLADGQHQIAADLQLQIPGIAKATLTLAVGEREQYSAWASVGQPGSMVRTAQLKFRLVAEIGGTGVLHGLAIRLPLYVEAAYADARLAEVECDLGGGNSVSIAVTPGVARAAIADVSDATLRSPRMWQSLDAARLVQAPLVTVNGRAVVTIGNISETSLRF